ncbi:MAG: leucine-rich repeat protein [Oscillospiraceae bacterium]|nr:leucine-rich repeat protein [Oscillospiraceae bacterium]
MKKVLCILFAMLLIICTGTVCIISASSAETDFTVENGVLVSYNGTNANVVIPDNVYYIGDSAFENNEYVKTVELNDNVKFLGNKAFYNCKQLNSLYGASGVTSVGAFALEGTAYLNSITNEFVELNGVLVDYNGNASSLKIPKTVTSIAPYVLYKNTSIVSLEFEGDTFEIGEGAFYGCTSLQSVTVPKSVNLIGAYAFYDTPWLKGQSEQVIAGDGILISYNGNQSNVSVKDGVKKIAPYAFYENKALKSVSMPSSVYVIGLRSFMGCENLATVKYPDCLKFIDEEAFAKCTALSSIYLPKSVQHLGKGAFAGCISLTRAEMGGNLQRVSYGTFAGCTALRSVYINDDAYNIYDNCFWGCSSLEKIRVSSAVTAISQSAFKNCGNVKLYSDNSSYLKYYCSRNNIPYGNELGDVDGNGEINILDATNIQLYLAGIIAFDDEKLEAADANYSCNITIEDATAIQFRIAGLK